MVYLVTCVHVYVTHIHVSVLRSANPRVTGRVKVCVFVGMGKHGGVKKCMCAHVCTGPGLQDP